MLQPDTTNILNTNVSETYSKVSASTHSVHRNEKQTSVVGKNQHPLIRAEILQSVLATSFSYLTLFKSLTGTHLWLHLFKLQLKVSCLVTIMFLV